MLSILNQHTEKKPQTTSMFNLFASTPKVSNQEMLIDKLEFVKSQLELNPSLSNKKARLK